jgi:hypothetical protein
VITVKYDTRRVTWVVRVNPNLEQRQQGVEQQLVVRVAAEALDGHPVVGLVQEGQRGVVHQQGALQRAAHKGHVLDALVVAALDGALPEDAGGEDPALRVQGLDDGPRVVLQACSQASSRAVMLLSPVTHGPRPGAMRRQNHGPVAGVA